MSNHGTGKKLHVHGGPPSKWNEAPFPKKFSRRSAMDLSYPIWRLQARAEYERECAAVGKWTAQASSDGGDIPCSDEDNARMAAGCVARAEACEAAVAILKAAT